MALRIWLPLNGNLNNQGLAGNLNISSTGTSANASGKIGTCMKITQAVNLNYIPDLNNSSISLCGWFKFNKSEITTAISGLTIDSTHRTVSGNILGNTSFGGLGIVWQSNDMYNSPPFSTMTIFGSIRTSTAGAINTSNFSAAFDTWMHLCVTFDRDTHKISLYKDGVFINSATFVDFSDGISRSLYLSYNAIWGGNGPACAIPMYSNDVRVYDHALSPKEVHEIAKGLVLHYTLDDPYIESTENLITTQDCLSSTCYNGATSKYGYGTSTDIYKTTGEFQDKFCTKVYMGTSGNSAYPYVYVANLYVSNGTNSPIYKTLSFDFYTNCSSTTYIIPYKLGSGNSTCTWFNNVTSTKTGTGTSSANIPVVSGTWNHITIVLHGTTDADAQWGYIRLGNAAHTSNISNYWLFTNMQLETKDHETGYAGVGGLRTSTTVYDTSGYGNNGTVLGTLLTTVDTAKYNRSTTFDGNTSGILIENLNIGNIINTALTYSFWIKPNGENNARSVYFGSYSGSSFSVEKTTANKLRLYWVGNPDLTTNLSISDGQWQHIVITKNGTSDMKVYLNGSLVQSFTNTFSNVTFPTTYRIGRDTRSDDGTPYKGNMSDFRIYSTSLSVDDILELYNMGGCIDNKASIYAYDFNEDSSTEIELNPCPTANVTLTNDGYKIAGHVWPASEYIPINPSGKTYYYDVEYSNTSGSQFYIGFEKYDENKASGSNSECQYVVSTNVAADHVRKTGTVNLSTANGNTAAYTKLRILNDWNSSGSGNASNIGTIHYISLKEVSAIQQTSAVGKTGIFIANSFISTKDASISKTGNVIGRQFIEI